MMVRTQQQLGTRACDSIVFMLQVF